MTKIEWTRGDDGSEGETWNPTLGCERISRGCDGCYAIRTATIRAGNPHPVIAAAYEGLTHRNEAGALDWTGVVRTLPDRLDKPLRWRKPRRVFVDSQSDLFHKDVPDEFIAHVWAVMATAERHTFQLLTKRHGRMPSLLSSERFEEMVRDEVHGSLDLTEDAIDWVQRRPWPLDNIWVGVSVEDQKAADLRIPALLDTPAAVRWLSCEPLLGPVDLSQWLYHAPNLYTEFGVLCTCGASMDSDENCQGPQLEWVVAGGETGPGARPMHPEWARTIRDYCEETGVPFFFKQWGDWGPSGARGMGAIDRGRSICVEPVDHLGQGEELVRVGKKATGRELDGRTWDEFPTAVTR